MLKKTISNKQYKIMKKQFKVMEIVNHKLFTKSTFSFRIISLLN